MENQYIVIFDGVCNFCNGAVKFIITPMQTQLAQNLMQKHQVYNVGIDTFLLIKNEQCYVFSTAALEISKDLKGLWFLFNVFRILPAAFRDYFYKLFARNRYQLFGRQQSCMVPADEVKSKFIGLD